MIGLSEVEGLGIPSLLPEKLATTIPTQVYAGGPVSDPATTLFVWRSVSLREAQGMIASFFVHDSRMEELRRNPERQTHRLLAAQIPTATEPDFSLWADEPLIVQAHNIYRNRWLGRYWQEQGLLLIPVLGWSDERSFPFAFSGIPVGAPLCATECRTPGGTDADRRAFLKGLTEGIRQTQPRHIIIYGGVTHRYWLRGRLPEGPGYTLLPALMDLRYYQQRQKALATRHRHQLELFKGGKLSWEEEEVAEPLEL